MEPHISHNDIYIGNEYGGYTGVPEYPFFASANSGEDMSGSLPMPEGVTRWYNAMYRGSSILYADNAAGDVYVVTEDARKGLCLFHYVYVNQGNPALRFSNNLPCRAMTNERSKNNMSNPKLSAMANMVGQNGMQPMNLQAGGFPAAPAADGIGVSGGADTANISALARLNGYVFGYIVRNAPSISAKLRPIHGQDKTITGHEIRFVQTKPSGLMRVLLALPSCCVLHNGNIASPSLIYSGSVDYSSYAPTELTYLDLTEEQAIPLIQALGGRIPEYRPNIDKAYNTQWTGEEIQSSPDVSFVEPRAGKSKSTKPEVVKNGGYIIHLKSTRGMLFTQHNVMCMRALEHLDCPTASRGNDSSKFGSKNDQQEFQLNESAFGRWRFSPLRENGQQTNKTMAQVALAECPNDIWEKAYKGVNPDPFTKDAPLVDVDDGFGSRFFAQQGTAGTEHGFDNSRTEFYPWYVSASAKRKDKETGKAAAAPVPVPQITFRQIVDTKDKTSKRASTKAILWRDDENHQMFAPYAPFVNALVSTGFMSREKLRNLGGRAARKGSGARKVPEAVATVLKNLVNSAETNALFDSVRETYANRTNLQYATR